MLTVGSLFSGIGGLELGLEMTGGFQTRWQVEIEPFCQKVLAKHWPNAERFSDVRDVGGHNLAPVDLICGGFPCQDVSNAGTTHEGGLKGLQGARSGLWYELARIIRELEPRWVVIENVGALTSRGLETVLWQMAALGYDAEGQVLSAGAVGAPHLRKRLFIVGQRKVRRADELPDCDLCGEPYCPECRQHFADCGHPGIFDFLSDADSAGLEGDVSSLLAQSHDWRSDAHAARSTWWGAEPELHRVADGVSDWVDETGRLSLAGYPKRKQRLQALGNAVCPQMAYFIGQRILASEGGGTR